MKISAGLAEVAKEAITPSDARRLAAEAENLTTWSHPGLVRLIRRIPPTGPSVDELVTAAASGSLAEVQHPPLELLAGWIAAVATVLGDLHSVGLAHGAVTADHILLDGDGRPLLCSLGGAVRRDECLGPDAFEAACAADLRALAALMIGLAPPGRETERLARRLDRWERSRRGDLASVILDCVPAARVGPPSTAAPETSLAAGGAAEPPSRRFERCRMAIVGAVVAGVVVVSVVAIGSGRASQPATPSDAIGPTATSLAAPADAVVEMLPGYRLRTPDAGRALTVLGRWNCGQDRPAVLYVGDGTVWVFPSWPATGEAVGAVHTATVAGATGLAVQGGSAGCDSLVVLRGDRPPVSLDAEPGR